jgi:F0F1-type ATP synthase assembly protein I
MLWIPAGMILGITVGLSLDSMVIGMPIGIAAILLIAHITRSLNRIFN